jgi:hypothetical protein
MSWAAYLRKLSTVETETVHAINFNNKTVL